MRYIFLIIAFLLPMTVASQLAAPGSRTVRFTEYPSAPTVPDPVFIYCNNPAGTQLGELRATSPGGTGPFDFNWYRWNPTLNNFSELVKTETGVVTSSLTNLGEGGYRVVISGGYDTVFTGWIHIDRPIGKARLRNFTCEYVALGGGRIGPDPFFYEDINTGNPVRLPNGVTFLWSSDPQSVIPFPDLDSIPQTFTPPLEDVTYKLHVSDSFGCINESSFFYESIHVKAEFSADPVKGEAPLEVVFTDKSVRADKQYIWDFGEVETLPNGTKVRKTWKVGEDSLSLFTQPFTHTYYIPDEYSVTLIIESKLGCIDSFKLEEDIIVEPSDLGIPNVFTPNGDGINDFFIPESKSLRFLSVEIFSRSGLRVYSFTGEGENLAAWQGWDGNVNNTSARATPGVYYYVIRALGWDDVEYNSKEQRGFVYLYR